jgi:hypothetical protein
MITPSNGIRISSEEQTVLAAVGNGSIPIPLQANIIDTASTCYTQREERRKVAIIAVLADGGVELNANDTNKEWFSLLFLFYIPLVSGGSKIRLLLCERMC